MLLLIVYCGTEKALFEIPYKIAQEKPHNFYEGLMKPYILKAASFVLGKRQKQVA